MSPLIGAALIAGGIGQFGNWLVNAGNYRNQVNQLDYQKDLQQQIFNREDTALQRRMQDAKDAGLNPYSVINSGGANSGSVVKTEAPQMQNFNMNGVLDTLSSIMDLQQRKEQTQALKLDNQSKLIGQQNQLRDGLLLDSRIQAQNWQNSILGYQNGIIGYEYADRLLDSLRHQAEFNYDFGTSMQYLLDDEGRYTSNLYDAKSMRPLSGFYGSPGNKWYDRNMFWDEQNQFGYNNMFYADQYNKYYYNNYMKKDTDLQHDMLQYNHDLLNKQNNWYNWNQGFDMLTGAIDTVSGLLFKNLDLGFRRADQESLFKLRRSQTYKNYASSGYMGFF